MKRLMIATATAAALFAGVGAASAQTYYDNGYTYGPRGPMVERGVGLQVGPVGVGVYAQEPTWDDGYAYHPRTRSNSAYESNIFRSQERLPQSPPGGGY